MKYLTNKTLGSVAKTWENFIWAEPANLPALKLKAVRNRLSHHCRYWAWGSGLATGGGVLWLWVSDK